MLSAAQKEKMEAMARRCGASRLAWISPAAVETSAAFRRSCEMNQCGRYGACWSCPPALAGVDKLREVILSYADGLVFQLDTAFADDFDYEAMEAGALEFYGLCRCLEAKLRQTDIRALVLGAGSCRECRRCTYPDRPCVRPEGPVYSLEAFGVDVMALCSDCGLPYLMQAGTVPYTGLALVGSAGSGDTQ